MEVVGTKAPLISDDAEQTKECLADRCLPRSIRADNRSQVLIEADRRPALAEALEVGQCEALKEHPCTSAEWTSA